MLKIIISTFYYCIAEYCFNKTKRLVEKGEKANARAKEWLAIGSEYFEKGRRNE